MEFSKEPISNIIWVKATELNANDYNPNIVFTAEMNLLKLSILTNGWLQPILCTKEKVIIDGFHRTHLAATDKDIIKKYDGYVPILMFDMSEPERMLLTVRINRAKGSQVAVKMHELITKVVDVHGYSREKVAKAIGATKDEIDLLLKQNVFMKLDTANHKYSMAWVPK